MKCRIRTPKGRARTDFFQFVLEVKMIALEVAITTVFFVWLYREVIHQFRN